MNFTSPILPKPPDDGWAGALTRALDEAFSSLHKDLRYGAATHRVLEDAPAAADVEEGEIVFVDDGIGGLAIYTKLNGTLRSGTLT